MDGVDQTLRLLPDNTELKDNKTLNMLQDALRKMRRRLGLKDPLEKKRRKRNAAANVAVPITVDQVKVASYHYSVM